MADRASLPRNAAPCTRRARSDRLPTEPEQMAKTVPKRSELRAKVRDSARNLPGVYRFVGARGEVLYVGKSVRVRTRLLSYFRGGESSRRDELLRSATDVEWEYVPNEFEALLRELRLIRSFRPRFNVRHRRERRYAWVRLTAGPVPRLVAARRPRTGGGRYFGPFPATRDLPGTLRELACEVGLRDCPDTTSFHLADQLDLLAPRRSPGCIRAELESCPAPCAGGCTQREYGANVRRAIAFLEGTTDEVLGSLQRQLTEAAEAREFERAARIRDRTERLQRLGTRVTAFRDHLARLNFVYTIPRQATDEARQGPEADDQTAPPAAIARSRSYLVVGGRVRHTFDAGPQAAPPPLRPVRAIIGEPTRPPSMLNATEREELFLVSGWFDRNPEELNRTRSIEAYLREPNDSGSGSTDAVSAA